MQIVSPSAHKSMVLAGIQRADDDRRRADVAHELIRWFAEQGDCGDVVGHLGGIGAGTSAAGTPSGTTAEVTNPATTAPCENPPSTILVLGQFAAVAWTWAAASLIPSMTVAANWMPPAKSLLAG